MVTLFSNTFAANVEPSSKFIIELIHPPLPHFRIISLDPLYFAIPLNVAKHVAPPQHFRGGMRSRWRRGAILSQSVTVQPLRGP